jgi:hypothetical protein
VSVETDHQAAIVDDFLAKNLHAECRCGWEGEPAATEHLALADWAAHVHVALGMAVPEGDRS